MSINIGILLFENVEVLDFAGPFEVFSVAAATASEDSGEPPFTVFTLAERAGLIRCTGGLKVQPDYTLEHHPPINVLVVPGGWGTRREVENAPLIEWIRGQAAHAQVTTSVCTGAFLLGRAGLLEGHRVTTHWASIERLRHALPNATVLENVRFLDEGAIVTSAGISAGIDMALHMVGRLHSAELAQQTARRMEYVSGKAV